MANIKKSKNNGPVCYLIERKNDQVSWEENYDTRLEGWYTPEVEQWSCIASLDSWKNTASSVPPWQGWEKEVARSIATYQLPGDMLTSSSN